MSAVLIRPGDVPVVFKFEGEEISTWSTMLNFLGRRGSDGKVGSPSHPPDIFICPASFRAVAASDKGTTLVVTGGEIRFVRADEIGQIKIERQYTGNEAEDAFWRGAILESATSYLRQRPEIIAQNNAGLNGNHVPLKDVDPTRYVKKPAEKSSVRSKVGARKESSSRAARRRREAVPI